MSLSHNDGSDSVAVKKEDSSLTHSTDQQRHWAGAKRKALGAPVDVNGYFQRLSQIFNEEPDGDEQHDPNTEAVPPLPQYLPAFAQAELAATATIHKVFMQVADEPDQDSESLYMHERLVAIEHPAYPSPIRVGICGSSGIGKSTLINAIFGFPTLCPTSENDAGTYVAMELVQATAGQSTKFAFHVDIYPLDDCIRIVRWAIKVCYDSYNEQDNDNIEDDADRGGPALKILLALLQDKDDFADEEAAADFLRALDSPEDPQGISKILAWVHDIHKKLSIKVAKEPMTANTAEELAELIEPYIQNAELPMIELGNHDTLECCVWPFVRLARVSFAHPILAKNIVFADLPGLTDTNAHRVRAAKRYLRKCDFIFVAHANTRAADDPEFKKNIKICHRLKRNGNIAALITQSDKATVKKSARVPYTLDEQGQLDAIESHHQLIKTELAAVQKRLKTTKTSSYNDGGLTSQLREKELLYKLHLQHAESLKKQIAVAARNRQITNDLQSFYKRDTNDLNDLRVFCVSSEQYLQHLQPHPPLDAPMLPLHLTGLPDLRYFIQELPAKSGHADALVHHCLNVVPGVLNAITLSCSGFKPMLKREHLNKIILAARENLPKQLRQARKDFWTSHISETVLTPIDLYESVWLDKAGKLCARWSKYNASGHLAFLKHEGAWKTGKCPQADWNQELLDALEAHLRPALDVLCDNSSKTLQEDFAQNVADVFDQLRSDLRTSLDTNQHGAFVELFENIQRHGNNVEAALKYACKYLAAKIPHLAHNAMTNNDSNPFVIKMQNIYNLAINASTTKEHRSRHAARSHVFKTALLNPKIGPYKEIKGYLETRIEALLQDVEKRLIDSCDAAFNNILHDFDSVCPRRADDTPGATKRRHALGEVVEEAKATFNTEVKARLLECGLRF